MGTKTRIGGILVIFEDRRVQLHHIKGLGESFPLMGLNISLSWKIREWCVLWVFVKVDLRSAISFKRSRPELSIDVAEHRSIYKNNQNTTPFYFYTQNRHRTPWNGCFLLSYLHLIRRPKVERRSDITLKNREQIFRSRSVKAIRHFVSCVVVSFIVAWLSSSSSEGVH